MKPSITQDMINTALGDLIESMMPAGFLAIVGQINRTPEPEGDYAVFWPLHRPRFSTNVHTEQDCKFTGSINGGTMIVSAVAFGDINIEAQVFGVGVANNTTISAQVSGSPGGIGVYTVSPNQTITSQILSAGQIDVSESTHVIMQVDIHGPNSTDNAQTFMQLFRDQYSVTFLEGTGISPLYADDPRQTPFINAASDYEDRWSIDTHLQITPVISIPQQFADQATITVVDVNTIPTA